MTLPDPPRSASATAPAGVGNIGVGFDLLGHTIDGPRDRATLHRIDACEVRVIAVRGDGPNVERIPFDLERNTAGLAVRALHAGLGLTHGFEIELDKGSPIGAGLGGSAASSIFSNVGDNSGWAARRSRNSSSSSRS